MNKRHPIEYRDLIPKVVALALCAAPLIYSQQPAPLSHSDSSFMKDAAEGQTDEIKLGDLAQQNGVSARVKTFGKRMATDHAKLQTEMQSLASKKSLTLPSDIGIKQKASYKLLSSKTGASFDKSYISSMVKDHEDDITAFQKEADTGTDADVKEFASKALPTLREHLRMAEDIARELGVSSK